LYEEIQPLGRVFCYPQWEDKKRRGAELWYTTFTDEATWKTDGNERDNIKINTNNAKLESIGFGPGPITSSFEHINVASFSKKVRSSDKLSN
jgi:hypothetical protein